MHYLDGNYFYPALSQIDDRGIVDPEPFVVQVRENSIQFTQVHQLRDYNEAIVRLIIETYNNNDEVTSRHSNLLIVQGSVVYRFEPMKRYIDIDFRELFPGYDVQVEDYHPQSSDYVNSDDVMYYINGDEFSNNESNRDRLNRRTNHINGPTNHINNTELNNRHTEDDDYNPRDLWCNAYVIERASAYIQGRQPKDINGADYAHVIMAVIKPLPGDPDIEFGWGGGWGVGGGVLGGALLGGLVGGVPGAVVGGTLGGLTGGLGGWGGRYGRHGGWHGGWGGRYGRYGGWGGRRGW